MPKVLLAAYYLLHKNSHKHTLMHTCTHVHMHTHTGACFERVSECVFSECGVCSTHVCSEYL